MRSLASVMCLGHPRMKPPGSPYVQGIVPPAAEAPLGNGFLSTIGARMRGDDTRQVQRNLRLPFDRAWASRVPAVPFASTARADRLRVALPARLRQRATSCDQLRLHGVAPKSFARARA